ncbi:Uncharacterized protein SCF082_LOCUS25635 [Durusdinium trenchii]|uniref:Uncharacterized protein n=1 Tax=Durusdinium trenchii TaxID=1381693 RepID=A0ABP0M1J4_9DINO
MPSLRGCKALMKAGFIEDNRGPGTLDLKFLPMPITAFVFAVLMVIWSQRGLEEKANLGKDRACAHGPENKDTTLEWIEFFAGRAEATRMMQYAGYSVAKLDLNYAHDKADVTKCTWYMLAYGGPTPKPHYALSNSKHISKLWTGKLRGWAKAVRENPTKKSKTVIKYQDSNGKHRWKGSAKLRQSEEYPPRFGLGLVSIYLDLVNEKIGPPPLPASIPSAEDTFQAMVFDDLWAEADLQAVCHYLRGGTGLVIPPSFRPLLPRRL